MTLCLQEQPNRHFARPLSLVVRRQQTVNQALQLAYDSSTERSLHILSIPSAADIPQFEVESEYFGVLMVWDSIGKSEEELVAVGKKLIGHGAVYVCCWGPGCEYLHDAIDHADRENDRPGDSVLMTTWHVVFP